MEGTGGGGGGEGGDEEGLGRGEFTTMTES